MKNVKGPITEINQDSFWDLIHEAKNACGQDMDAMLAYLKDRLVSMGPTQAQIFTTSSTPMKISRTSSACGTRQGS